MRYQHCPHKDCAYRAGEGAQHECDYAGITGHCRIKGLTKEQAQDKLHCPKYVPLRGKARRRSPQTSIPRLSLKQ